MFSLAAIQEMWANAWPIIAFAAALFICLYLLARFNDRGKLADS